MKNMNKNNRFWLQLLLALPLIILMGVSTSCKEKYKVRSLSEMLRDEKKCITAFIEKNNLQIESVSASLPETPSSNTFYLFPNGVYLRVLDKGGEMAVVDQTTVMVRYKGYFFNPEPVAHFDNLSKGHYQNTEFRYIERYDRGALHFELLPSAPGYNLNEYMCEGVAFALTQVGNGARVQLIVPFLQGPESSYKLGYPLFFEEVLYQFVID